MSIRFFRRSKSPEFKGIRERSTVVRSAEAAWPFRGPGRTVEENLEALERVRRYLGEAPPEPR
jgi:hypothetical protein